VRASFCITSTNRPALIGDADADDVDVDDESEVITSIHSANSAHSDGVNTASHAGTRMIGDDRSVRQASHLPQVSLILGDLSADLTHSKRASEPFHNFGGRTILGEPFLLTSLTKWACDP
jgi:hypothetical protein